MRFKVVITILDFFTLLAALVNGFFSLYSTCFDCPGVLFYGQFFDVVAYGLLLLVFFFCIADMAKESFPIKMQLTASFSAAILYFMAAGLYIFIIFHDDIIPILKLGFSLFLGVLHACVGLLFVFRDKLTRLT